MTQLSRLDTQHPGPGEDDSPGRPVPPQKLTQILEAAGGTVAALVATWIAALVLAIVASPSLALWIALAFIGSVFSGLVGTGVVLTIPLLLYGPPLVGRESMSIHAVTGASTVLVAVVGIAGALSHVRDGNIKWSLIPIIGGAMAPAALAGAALSSLVSGPFLAAIFAVLVAAAAVVLILGQPAEQPDPSVPHRAGSLWLAAALGAGLGFLLGMGGLGGGFLLVPLMTYLLNVPLRVAVGSSLGILAVTGLFSMVGKAATGQIDWVFAAALVAGGLPGVRVGSWISTRINVRLLSLVLGFVLALLAVKMWWDILR